MIQSSVSGDVKPKPVKILLKWSESPWKISPLAVKSQTTQIEVKDKTMMSAPEIFISPELFWDPNKSMNSRLFFWSSVLPFLLQFHSQQTFFSQVSGKTGFSSGCSVAAHLFGCGLRLHRREKWPQTFLRCRPATGSKLFTWGLLPTCYNAL